jgi:hypothetical protein
MGRAHLVLATVFVSLLPGLAPAQTPPEGWVVLPVDEYRTLREKAIPPPPAAATPPMDATLTRIDYDLRADGDTVSGRVALTIDVLRDGWTRLQLPAGLMARDAALDSQPVTLAGGPPPSVLLSRRGRSTLTLDVVLPLAASAGAESLVIPQSAAPISRVRLALPRSGVDLIVAGGLLGDRTEAATESRWTVFGRPNQGLTMTWKRKVDDRRADLPLKARAQITELVGLGEDACQVSTTVRVDVTQGLAREVVLTLPATLAVNQVDGATVADWSVADGQLRVRFLEPVASSTSFVVQADAKTPRDGAIAIPLVRMPAAERETGGVAVDVLGAGEIGDRQMRGLEPADASELGDAAGRRESPSLVAFRHRPIAGVEPRALTVSVVRYTPQAVIIANVEEARYRALASEDGQLLVEARYAIRNNQRSFLKATLPEGATVWSAEIAGRPIRPGLAEGRAILLPLEKGRGGEDAPPFIVAIVYVQRIEPWQERSRPRLDLPALDLPVSRTGVELHYSPRFRVDLQPGPFRLDVDTGAFTAMLPEPPPPPAAARSRDEVSAGGLQALIDRYRKDSGGRTIAGVLPVHVSFPAFGPSLFLAAELTAESEAPAIDLIVKRANSREAAGGGR